MKACIWVRDGRERSQSPHDVWNIAKTMSQHGRMSVRYLCHRSRNSGGAGQSRENCLELSEDTNEQRMYWCNVLRRSALTAFPKWKST